MTSPMIAASAPSGWARMASSSRAASASAQMAISLPSLATYSGSRPRNSQAASTCGRTGMAASWITMPQPDCAASSLSVVARPPRVGSRRQWMPGTASHHGRHQAVQRRGVAADGGLEAEVLAQRHDGHAVVADRAADQDAVAGPRAVARDLHARGHHADAGGGDEDAVALALFDHLGVAGDHRHAGLARGRGHRLDDALQVGQRESLPRG